MVFDSSVDIAHLKVLDSSLFLDILVQSVSIGTHPHIAIFVEQHLFDRVFTDRGLIELVVHKAPCLLRVHIDNPQALMVGTKPEPVTLIFLHHPSQQVFWYSLNALRTKEAVDGIIPFLFFLAINEAHGGRQDPDVSMIIDIQIILALFLSSILTHIRVFPDHLSARTINCHQVTVTGRHDEQVVIFCKRREPELVGELLSAITVFDECTFLCLGVIAIESVGISLHPQVLLRIDIDTVDTARDAQLGEHRRRIAHDLLRDWVEERVVHTLFQPQLSVDILPDHINIVAAQRQRVVGIGIKRTETVAVVTVQTIRGAYPDIALGVLEEIVQLGI